MRLGTKLIAISILLGNLTVAQGVTPLQKTQLEQLIPDIIEQASKNQWQADLSNPIPLNTQQYLMSIFKPNHPNDIISGYGKVTSMASDQPVSMTIYWSITNGDTQIDHSSNVQLSLNDTPDDWTIQQIHLVSDQIVKHTQLKKQRFEHCH